jgi:hypothetical protein
MEHSRTVTFQKKSSRQETDFRLKQCVPTGILNWQEFADIPFQELMERAHQLNTLFDERND